MIEVSGGGALKQAVQTLLAEPARATEMGRRAQEVVRQEKGSTARHAKEILTLLRARLDVGQ